MDGLHQSDVDWYVSTHASSTMAALVAHGVDYTRASTPFPSDSFPGLVAQVTGGNPSSTGIYYDVSYNRALLPPGTTSCAGVAPGTAVAYDESLDRDPSRLDAGQGVAGIPATIL
ncbi:MAG: alkaline phosphatase family protein, partial [Actinomycetota bacterium]|nr:alkaline phosphatase family protein [Actinomycetota bacterium]